MENNVEKISWKLKFRWEISKKLINFKESKFQIKSSWTLGKKEFKEDKETEGEISNLIDDTWNQQWNKIITKMKPHEKHLKLEDSFENIVRENRIKIKRCV